MHFALYKHKISHSCFFLYMALQLETRYQEISRSISHKLCVRLFIFMTLLIIIPHSISNLYFFIHYLNTLIHTNLCNYTPTLNSHERLFLEQKKIQL